jgi:hypothetical protein
MRLEMNCRRKSIKDQWLAANDWVKDEMQSSGHEMQKTYDLFLKDQRHWSQILTLLLTKTYQQERLELPVLA